MRLVVAAAAVTFAVLAGQAHAATPAQIVARLNAERAANGIPGGIVLDRAWTTGCEHHVRYEELNGIAWTHQETPGRPGFTKDGQLAGLLGDQQAGLGSFDGSDPFDRLPLHLADLLAPTLAQVGAFERGGRTCSRVSSGYTRQIAANALFVAPGTFFVIPVSPLRPGTTYSASVTVANAQGTSITKTWQFRTA